MADGSDEPIDAWNEEAKRLLKAELVRRGITFKELSDRLATVGVRENARQLTNKVNRGTFSAAFFLKVMRAIEASSVDLSRR